MLHHYGGAFTWHELWNELPGREVIKIHDQAQQQSKQDQQLLAYQAWILARNPYIGGFKDVDIDDLYTGLARYKVEEPPYPLVAMRGIAMALRMDIVGQAHLDLLNSKATLKWLKARGMLKSGRANPRARQGSRRGRTRSTH